MPAVASGVVAVTGANGFIGSHVVKQLLGAGYTVRAIVRDKDSEEKTSHLKKAAQDEGAADRLVLFSGDLMKAGDYDEAFAGADAVVHTAAFVVRPHPLIAASMGGTGRAGWGGGRPSSPRTRSATLSTPRSRAPSTCWARSTNPAR